MGCEYGLSRSCGIPYRGTADDHAVAVTRDFFALTVGTEKTFAEPLIPQILDESLDRGRIVINKAF